MQSPQIRLTTSRRTGRLAASLVLATGLLFAPAALASTAPAQARHSEPIAHAADSAVLHVPLSRGPGVYMVRVTVSGPHAGKNRVRVTIGPARSRVLTVRAGHHATLQLPVRVRGRMLTIRAIGRSARPKIHVIKWLMKSIRVSAPPGTAVPVTPHRKLPGAHAVKPAVHHGGAAAVAVPIPHPGIYQVKIAIRSRAPRRNRVRLQIGWLTRSEVTNRHGGASLSVKIRLSRPTLMVRARSSRAKPVITLSVRRLAPVVQAVKPKPKAPTTVAAQVPPPVAPPPVAPSGAAGLVFPQAVPASSGPVGLPGSWKLAFDDEFNGSSLDSSKWASSWFGGGNMNNVSTSPSNVSVANGALTLTLSSSSSGALVSTNPSGGASPGFQFTYGVVEARIWLAGSGGTVADWPAFWTDGQSWPSNGEADIVEGLGSATSNYHSNNGTNNSGTIAGTWAGGWHTYTLDREPGKNTIYWDGKIVRSYQTYDNGAPQYIILNIGSGSTIGATMQVDYVRAWTH